MVDYAESINTSDFLYRRNVYYTSTYPTFKEDIVAKLVLNSNNFNFDLANENGDDFRLVHNSDVLRMWKAHWSKDDSKAVLFFKLQNVEAGEKVKLYAYWGNNLISPNSEPDKLGFLFYEDFESGTLDSNKWSGSTSNGISTAGYLISDGNTFSTNTQPLLNKNSWVLEAGFYADWDTGGNWSSLTSTVGVGFEGTENDFKVRFMHMDRVSHNAIVAGGGSYTTEVKSWGGLEGRSQNDIFISYYEPNDEVNIELQNRSLFPNSSYAANRKVEGDTRPNNITIHPREFYTLGRWGAYPTYINWLVIRDYDEQSLGNFDGSELYIPYETITPQNEDYRDYGPSIVSTLYNHESSFGGNPYHLSNNIYDDDINAWISDEGAADEDYVTVTINMAWHADQLVSRSFKHYDSGHVYYYNASKLSDSDSDFMGRNFWHCTTTSGYAAIRFNEPKNIGFFRIKLNEDLEAGPKEYILYGSDYYPGTTFYGAQRINEGEFEKIEGWQSRKLNNERFFKYYILYVKNTFGNVNIKLQEWEMYDAFERSERFYISQLRLYPSTFGEYQSNFPKEIMLEGSLDGTNWETLMPWTQTYTPFVKYHASYGYWQRYSFTNVKGYWSFRLRCKGNWAAPDSRIIIGEWSLHELAEEVNTHRILAGSTNNIKQIWAHEDTTFNNTHGMFYAANERLTLVSNNKNVGSKDLPEDYNDFNVI